MDPTTQDGRLITDAVHDVTVVDTVANNLGIVAAIAFCFYIAAFVCAVREIMNSRTAQGSIAWLLSLFFLPFLTVPLYLVFGWKSFGDYLRIQSDLGRLGRRRRAERLELTDREETRQWPVLSKIAGLPFLAGNSCDLLIDGTQRSTRSSTALPTPGTRFWFSFSFFGTTTSVANSPMPLSNGQRRV